MNGCIVEWLIAQIFWRYLASYRFF